MALSFTLRTLTIRGKVTGLNGSRLNTVVANGRTADGCRTHDILYTVVLTGNVHY